MTEPEPPRSAQDRSSQDRSPQDLGAPQEQGGSSRTGGSHAEGTRSAPSPDRPAKPAERPKQRSTGTPERRGADGAVVPRTRAGALWVAAAASIVVLVLLIIFIAQNTGTVGVHFLGLYGQISLGLMLLIAAVVGAALVVIVGTARILQLRLVARRNRDLEPRRG